MQSPKGRILCTEDDVQKIPTFPNNWLRQRRLVHSTLRKRPSNVNLDFNRCGFSLVRTQNPPAATAPRTLDRNEADLA